MVLFLFPLTFICHFCICTVDIPGAFCSLKEWYWCVTWEMPLVNGCNPKPRTGWLLLWETHLKGLLPFIINVHVYPCTMRLFLTQNLDHMLSFRCGFQKILRCIRQSKQRVSSSFIFALYLYSRALAKDDWDHKRKSTTTLLSVCTPLMCNYQYGCYYFLLLIHHNHHSPRKTIKCSHFLVIVYWTSLPGRISTGSLHKASSIMRFFCKLND